MAQKGVVYTCTCPITPIKYVQMDSLGVLSLVGCRDSLNVADMKAYEVL